jgi:hypothetical protein
MQRFPRSSSVHVAAWGQFPVVKIDQQRQNRRKAGIDSYSDFGFGIGHNIDPGAPAPPPWNYY